MRSHGPKEITLAEEEEEDVDEKWSGTKVEIVEERDER
jgi:hypothetical protein